jgi:hypothetical protein
MKYTKLGQFVLLDIPDEYEVYISIPINADDRQPDSIVSLLHVARFQACSVPFGPKHVAIDVLRQIQPITAQHCINPSHIHLYSELAMR